MRLEHHLVGGYVRYKSPHIIIIIIIIINNKTDCRSVSLLMLLNCVTRLSMGLLASLNTMQKGNMI